MTEEAKTEQEKPPIVPINGKYADLRNALPLTIGDVEKLKARGINLVKLEQEPENAYPLALYIVGKANKDISEQEIKDHMPMNYTARILQVMREEQAKVEIPF